MGAAVRATGHTLGQIPKFFDNIGSDSGVRSTIEGDRLPALKPPPRADTSEAMQKEYERQARERELKRGRGRAAAFMTSSSPKLGYSAGEKALLGL